MKLVFLLLFRFFWARPASLYKYCRYSIVVFFHWIQSMLVYMGKEMFNIWSFYACAAYFILFSNRKAFFYKKTYKRVVIEMSKRQITDFFSSRTTLTDKLFLFFVLTLNRHNCITFAFTSTYKFFFFSIGTCTTYGFLTALVLCFIL